MICSNKMRFWIASEPEVKRKKEYLMREVLNVRQYRNKTKTKNFKTKNCETNKLLSRKSQKLNAREIRSILQSKTSKNTIKSQKKKTFFLLKLSEFLQLLNSY